jgi:hypothetical protein
VRALSGVFASTEAVKEKRGKDRTQITQKKLIFADEKDKGASKMSWSRAIGFSRFEL